MTEPWPKNPDLKSKLEEIIVKLGGIVEQSAKEGFTWAYIQTGKYCVYLCAESKKYYLFCNFSQTQTSLVRKTICTYLFIKESAIYFFKIVFLLHYTL